MQALGIDTASTSQAPRSALSRDGRDATLHVGLAGAIGLLLLYLSIRFSAFLATAVTGERSRRTWEDLALTGISAGDAMAGKVLGSVVLPLTQEGLIIGGTLVFTGCVTAYITPAMLGGPKVLMLETLLYQKVNVAGDLPAASVIAVLLLVTTIAVNQGLRRVAR